MVTYMNEIKRDYAYLQVSAEQHGLLPSIVGLGEVAWWPEGLGRKINALRGFLASARLGAEDLVLFADAFDTLILGDAAKIRAGFERRAPLARSPSERAALGVVAFLEPAGFWSPKNRRRVKRQMATWVWLKIQFGSIYQGATEGYMLLSHSHVALKKPRSRSRLERSSGKSIFFPAERTCYPPVADICEHYPRSPTALRYLNSGLLIGRVGQLRQAQRGGGGGEMGGGGWEGLAPRKKERESHENRDWRFESSFAWVAQQT